jgi:hypothetical protein
MKAKRKPATKAKRSPDHYQDAFRRLGGNLDDLRRLAQLGMLAVEANEDELIRFTVGEMVTKAAAVWKQYQGSFPGVDAATVEAVS